MWELDAREAERRREVDFEGMSWDLLIWLD